LALWVKGKLIPCGSQGFESLVALIELSSTKIDMEAPRKHHDTPRVNEGKLSWFIGD
jgi:hypothetical protein